MEESPKNLRNQETLEMLAKLFADIKFRDWLWNERCKEVWELRKIKTGTIEGDALELSRQNGRISYVESLMNEIKTAYHDLSKIKPNKDAIKAGNK